MKPRHLALLVAASLALAGSLRAQIVVAPITDPNSFTGQDGLEGFNTLAQGTPIITQFTAEGLTFDGALMASTNGGDTNLYPNNADGVIATNWDGTPALTWTITFAVPQQRVGFLVEMNTSDSVQLTTSLASVTHGSVTYTSAGVHPVFFGVSDTGTFDQLTFTVSGPDNHFFAMDNFRYSAVPEPSTWALLATGLAVVGLMARTGRRRA